MELRIDQNEPVEAPRGQRCVHATGHIAIGAPGAPADKDIPESEVLLCTGAPGPSGGYMVTLSMSQVLPALADKERATIKAIFSSFQVNQQRVAQIANQMAAPAIAAIHQIGRDAAARQAATDRANDAQHRSWDNQQAVQDQRNRAYADQQDGQDRRNQAFSNYLLDQTVVQDNNLYGNGTVGHGTAWNSTADALVKSDPKRYEIVDTPGFWKGIDY